MDPKPELRFRNAPSELLGQEKFKEVCIDLSVVAETFNKQVARIANRNGISIAVETYYTLVKQ